MLRVGGVDTVAHVPVAVSSSSAVLSEAAAAYYPRMIDGADEAALHPAMRTAGCHRPRAACITTQPATLGQTVRINSMFVGVLPARHHHMMFAVMVLACHKSEESQPLYARHHCGIAARHAKLHTVFRIY